MSYNLSIGIRYTQHHLRQNVTVFHLFNLLTLFRSYNDTSEVTEPSVPGISTNTEGAGSITSGTAEHGPEAENVNTTHSDTSTNPAAYQSHIITVHRGNVRKEKRFSKIPQ